MRSGSCSQEYFYSASSCAGTPYVFDGQSLYGDGVYTATFSTLSGCDSVVHLTLNILPTSLTEMQYPLCEGSTLNFNGVIVDAPGTYTIHYTASWGCDSTVKLYVFNRASQKRTESKSLCGGDSIFFGNQWLNQSGIFESRFTGANGCDSVVTLDLQVIKFSEEIVVNGDVLSTKAVADKYQWLECPNYLAIQGATSAEFSAVKEGSYSIKMEKEGCVDTSICYFKSNSPATGFAQQITENVKIYPNPAKNIVNIKIPGNETAEMMVYNTQGQLIDVVRIDPNLNYQYDINGRLPGYYLLKIKYGQEQITQRLIIQ